MPFDVDTFTKTQFSPRTAAVDVPELSPFFDDGEAPVATVRMLGGVEIGRVLDEVSGNKRAMVRSLVAAAQSEDTDALIAALRDYIEDKNDRLPDDVVRRTYEIAFGLVSPALDFDGVKKLRDNYSEVFYRLSERIRALSAQGADIAGE